MVTVFFVLCAWLVLAIRRSLFGRRLVALNDSPAAYATVGLNIGFTKVAVFAIAAGMAGLAGALYGTVQQTVGHLRLRLLPRHHLRPVRDHLEHPHRVGRVPRRPHLRRAQPVLAERPRLFAGVGIILIGRAANGILGIEALQFRLPWVTGAVGRRAASVPRRPGARR